MYINYSTLGNIKNLLCKSENFNPRRIEFDLIKDTNLYDVKIYITGVVDGKEVEAIVNTKSKFPSNCNVVIDNNAENKEVFSIVVPEETT